jgi:6-phosphogluconolactonase (cycloisomerase 2 family)
MATNADPIAADTSRRAFLKAAAAVAASAPLSSVLRAQAPAGGAPLLAYVGTFSSPLRDVLPTQVDLPPGNGRGIHIFQVDRASGALTPRGTFDLGTSPSCLALNKAGTRLYSSNETDRVGEGKHGTVSAFAIDRAGGQLTELNKVPSGGAGPTYVSVHPSGKFLLVANYFGGSVAVLPVLADGSLGPATDVKEDAGTIGPRRATNAPPGTFAFSGHDRTHAHMVQADASGRFVLHVDLGLDRIVVGTFDAGRGLLTPGDHHEVALPPGDGPRHFAFHPNGRWFYSIQEEGSTIVLFDWDGTAGRLTSRQTISSLPPGYAGSNFCSEILVSADGRFVYGGNRLHDTVGIFAVGGTGELTFVADEPTRGNYPRSFNFDPTGRFLYCCNQRADNVTAFRVDAKTGRLQFTGHYAAVGNPSHIVFVDLAESG